jgi:competence protein ComFB
VRNIVEDLVRRVHDELAPTVPEAHPDCAVCREDVMVYALNRLEPHYVATPRGEVLSKLDLEGDQRRADAMIVLTEAFRYVAANPRCGRPRSG